MRLLAFDTATPATVVGAAGDDGPVMERRHEPRPEERPGHAGLLELAGEVLDARGWTWRDVERIGVGVGPGSFTGLRIGVATARALAQSSGAEVVSVSTLAALALESAAADPARAVLAVLDARRGEAFVAAWRGEKLLLEARAVRPDGDLATHVAAAGPRPLAVGDGAVRFRDELEAAGAEVPESGSRYHGVAAASLLRLARAAAPVAVEALVPDYVRAPDASPSSSPA